MSNRTKFIALAAFGSASLAFGAAATATDAQREDRCDVQARSGHDLQTVEMQDLHVLAQTGSGQAFAPSLPNGAQAIVCVRTSIIPAAYDDKVLALGIPLIIVETGRPHRLGVLEINDGRYRYRMMEGALATADQAAVQARLQEYSARMTPPAG
jgi:hypothetical protein